ncbi:hypothetical protein [Polaribacter sp.]|uniref:hypothetical protein n=1 Tax=Polaribacter sp. TaxID=1920175 RepID=UPI003F6AB553
MATEKSILEKLSEPLKISDIDFRIQSISTSGWATILPYKDARVDMNRLDEVCGLDWQNKYELIDGQLFCSIGVKVDNEWVWRTDVGVESQSEKTKGRASDSFKRAGFRFGIGRELYDYPRIFLQLKGAKDLTHEKDKPEFKVKALQGGKKIGTSDWGLKLDKWTWDIDFDENNKVKRILGKDEKGVLRFDSNIDFNSLPKSNNQTQQTPPKQTPPPKTITKEKKTLSDSNYQDALKSDKLDLLTKALTTRALTPEQIIGISKRIEELKKKNEKD